MDATTISLSSAATQGVAVQAWFQPRDIAKALGALRALTEAGLEAGAWYVEAKYGDSALSLEGLRLKNSMHRGGRFVVVGQSPPSDKHYVVLKCVSPSAE